jgi:hypothetical protein
MPQLLLRAHCLWLISKQKLYQTLLQTLCTLSVKTACAGI